MKLVILVLLLAMVSGCRMLAGGPGDAGATADDKPDDPVASSPAPSGGEAPPGDSARREMPNPDVVDARGVGIDHFRIGPDGRTVVIYWWGGTPSCFALQEVRVDVQRHTPVVTVLEGTLPEAVGKPCTMEAILKSTAIVLDEPILIDGSGNGHPRGEPGLFGEAIEVAPRPDLSDPHEIAIAGYRLNADGTELQVHFVGGTERCYGLAVGNAEPTPDGPLVVTVAEGTLPGIGGACEDIGVAKFTTLELEEPLIGQDASDT